MKERTEIKKTARAALVGAVYALLTLVWPLSLGPIQIRLSEALCLLPIFAPEAVAGLFIGCLLGNLLSGAMWFDVIFGSLTTLAAACLTRKLRDRGFWIYALPPVVLNGVIVGTVVHFAYSGNPALSLLPLTMLTVGAGEAAAVYGIGGLTQKAFKRAVKRHDK